MFVTRVCLKYIRSATQRMEAKEGLALKGEPSLLERVIQSEKSEKLATIMALDMILVGIDTVSHNFCGVCNVRFHLNNLIFSSDFHGRVFYFVPSRHTTF